MTKGKRKSDSRAKDAGATSRPVRGSRADSAAVARRSVNSATGQDERPSRAAAPRLNRTYQSIIDAVVQDSSHDTPSGDHKKEIAVYCGALSKLGFDRFAITALFQQGLSSHNDLLSKD